jgi:hypothetical protein
MNSSMVLPPQFSWCRFVTGNSMPLASTPAGYTLRG